LLCHGTVCVVGKMRDLILQLSKSSIYSTKPTDTLPTAAADDPSLYPANACASPAGVTLSPHNDLHA
ncbi:hypothetical protein M3B34_19605, partial [Klebsiella quasipneumoniae]|nr:hypothetical protein [Klebsiella quasipneumoniae]